MDGSLVPMETFRQRPVQQAANRGLNIRHHRRVLVGRILLLATSTLMALLVAEVGLRLGGFTPVYVNPLGSFHEYDPVIGHRGKPNFVGRFKRPEFNVHVAHDANGFRNREALPEVSSQPAIYVLGDSFTWGWGVDRPYTSYMEPLCRGRRIRNLGLSATGTVQQFAIFQREVERRLTPRDIVVLAVYCNDLKDNLGLLGDDALHAVVEKGEVREIAPPPETEQTQLWDELRNRSCLMNLIGSVINEQKLLHRHKLAFAVPRGPAQMQSPDFKGNSPEFVVFHHYADKFRAACAASGTPLVMMYIPGRSEFHEFGEQGEDVPAQQQAACRHAVMRTCGDLKIWLCDLVSIFEVEKQREPNRRFTFHHDFHWNTEGHRLAGTALAEFLSNHFATPAETTDSSAVAEAATSGRRD